jgi:hypothetical protein
VRALIALYPRTWRDRYADELISLVEDTGLTFPRALDIIRTAARERARGWTAGLLGQTGASRYRWRLTGRVLVGIAMMSATSVLGLGLRVAMAGTSLDAYFLRSSFVLSLLFALPLLGFARFHYYNAVGNHDRPRRPIGRPEAVGWLLVAILLNSIGSRPVPSDWLSMIVGPGSVVIGLLFSYTTWGQRAERLRKRLRTRRVALERTKWRQSLRLDKE